MPQVNVHQAKTQLSKLLAQVEAGEEVIIARDGVPVARLVRALPAKRAKFGFGKHLWDKMKLKSPTLEPMTEAELAEFYDAPLMTGVPLSQAAAPRTKRRRKAG